MNRNEATHLANTMGEGWIVRHVVGDSYLVTALRGKVVLRYIPQYSQPYSCCIDQSGEGTGATPYEAVINAELKMLEDLKNRFQFTESVRNLTQPIWDEISEMDLQKQISEGKAKKIFGIKFSEGILNFRKWIFRK